MDREVFLVALRVLARSNMGLGVSAGDESFIRQNAPDIDIRVVAVEIAKRYLMQPTKAGCDLKVPVDHAA